MNVPRQALDCRNCDNWLGKQCPETGVALPCDAVTNVVEQALGGYDFERGLDVSSERAIAGRFVQLGTFPTLRIIGEQACKNILDNTQLTE